MGAASVDFAAVGFADNDMAEWQQQHSERSARLNAGSRYANGKMVPPESAKPHLETLPVALVLAAEWQLRRC